TAPTRQTQNKVQDLGAYPYFGAATAGGIRKHMGHKVMQERERSGLALPKPVKSDRLTPIPRGFGEEMDKTPIFATMPPRFYTERIGIFYGRRYNRRGGRCAERSTDAGRARYEIDVCQRLSHSHYCGGGCDRFRVQYVEPESADRSAADAVQGHRANDHDLFNGKAAYRFA